MTNIEELSALLNSQNPIEQIRGIEEAGKQESFFHILQILKLLSSPYKEVAKAGLPVLVTLAEKCLDPENQELPETVVYAAVRIISKLDRKFINRLNQQIKDNNPDVIIKTMMVLKYFVDKNRAKAILQRFLKHPEKKIRATAVLHMGGIASRATAENLTGFLQDSDNRVKANAIEVLEELNEESFVRILNRFRADENNRVRANALKALFKLGITSIGDDIKFMLMDPNPLMRASAVWALGDIGAEGAHLFKLLEIVKSDNEEIVRNNILILMRKVGDIPEIELLKEAFKQELEESSHEAAGQAAHLEIGHNPAEQYYELILSGQITTVTVSNMKALFQDLIEQHKGIVLNFSQVTFIDRAGMEFLRSIQNRLKKVGGFLYIHGCSVQISELFQFSNVRADLNLFHSLKDIHSFLNVVPD